jgi:hypothetical protein
MTDEMTTLLMVAAVFSVGLALWAILLESWTDT